MSALSAAQKVTRSLLQAPALLTASFRLRNDLYCVEWGVKLYSLTHSLIALFPLRNFARSNVDPLTFHRIYSHSVTAPLHRLFNFRSAPFPIINPILELSLFLISHIGLFAYQGRVTLL